MRCQRKVGRVTNRLFGVKSAVSVCAFRLLDLNNDGERRPRPVEWLLDSVSKVWLYPVERFRESGRCMLGLESSPKDAGPKPFASG